MAEKMTQYLGTGRRKTSVARVRLIPGGQGVEINGKAMDEYFGGRAILSKIVEQPLALTETLNKFAVSWWRKLWASWCNQTWCCKSIITC